MNDIIIGRSEEDRKKYGEKGAILIGKHFVQMGQTTSLSSPIYLDVAKSHVVFICGKRGSGKCLTGDTLICLEDCSLMPIKEIEKHDNIISLDEDLKLGIQKRHGFYKRKVNKTLKIKLRTGKEIELTPEHPLLTINGWVAANRLGIYDRIATPRRLAFFGDNDMEECKVKLLAYLIAEGHLGNRFVLFSNSDEQILDDFKNAIKQFDERLVIHKHSNKGDYRIVGYEKRKIIEQGKRDERGRFISGPKFNNYKSSLRKWIDSLGLYGKKSTEKFIPEEIFCLPKNKIALFLNRLFSCDGTIYYKKCTAGGIWSISYSSSSKKIINQVQHLLLKFGIISIIRERKIKYKDKYFVNYELTIIQRSIYDFLQEIGFLGKKELRAKKAIKECIKITPNTNVDTIPKEIWNSYHPKNWAEIGRKMGYKTPKGLRSSINYSPSRQKLLQIAELDNNEQITKIANSDIFWDEIIAIEEINKETEVYDISVPSTHNFVANDIIVHNSYTMGVIAEGVADLPPEIKQNISIIMLDTMGVYWSMKYPNKQDELLLKEWGMKSKPLDIQIYTPVGFHKKFLKEGIPTDFPFSIKPSELDANDWNMTFGISQNDPMGVLIERTINKLKEKKPDYSIEDIINEVREDEKAEQHVKDAVENRFLNTESWGLFDENGTPLKDLAVGGKVTVLDMSCYATSSNGWQIKNLAIGLVAQKLFIQRMIARRDEELQQIHSSIHYFGEEQKTQQEMPLVWLVIDECLPYSAKIQTKKGLREIGKIVNEFLQGKKIEVWGYNPRTKQYGFYTVSKSYKRPKKKLMTFITEIGKNLICTHDHKIFSRTGFCEAQKSKTIAIPLLKPYLQNKKQVEARLLGAIFGDGWLSTNGKSVGFSGKGNNKDLEKIKQDLATLGFKSSSIYSKRTKSIITSSKNKKTYVSGLSTSFTSSTKAHKYFKKLGAPIGTKVLVPSKVPSGILKGPKEVKCEFLAGLMGADGYTLTRNINIPSDFNPIRLSFNKIKELEENAWEFAKQLKKIFEDVGVKVSNISKRPGNIRKDGHETLKIQMTIAKSIDNTKRYLEDIGYRYCEKKEIEGQKWLCYLNTKKFILKERNKLRKKAIKLHKKKGLGKIRIGKILGLPDYVVREWIYYGKKAGVQKNFPSFEEWIKKRILGNNIFVKIIKKLEGKEEFVYDLSVDKVHNFVADGFLVHNCHEFLPNEGKTAATDALITILREGRQPGISLILATQQPGKIHTDVMTQSDTVIGHRITAKVDVDALGMLMQSYMREGLTAELDRMPRVKGAAIVFDDTNERMYPMRVRPRLTWHGGGAPTALHEVKKEL